MAKALVLSQPASIATQRSRTLTFSVLLALAALMSAIIPAQAAEGNYRNPIDILIPGGGRVKSCADPTMMRGQTTGDNAWYMYCTTDPLNNNDRTGGNYNFHLIPQLRSTDLVHWTYVGDAFAARPAWAEPTAGMWAPEIQYFNGQYYLYFGVTDVIDSVSGEPGCGGDSAIGVATSASPTGPWVDSGDPVIDPRRNGSGCNFFWTYDPEVITEHNGTQKYIYYGSYYGGTQVRQLSSDGLEADAGTATQISIPNRYEGTEILYRDGYYYFLGSATNCCNGPLTGYSVFTARSTSPTGPFEDRDGVSILNGRVGGTPFLTMNGNRWVGPGHQTSFQDFDGQWWTFYHAVDRNRPYFDDAVGFTRRPVLLDPIDWPGGWPTVRNDRWISAEKVPTPAAQPGQQSNYVPEAPIRHNIRALLDEDNFDGTSLGSGWSWVREPAADTWSVENGSFHMDTQSADLYVDSNNASVLVRDLPTGNWMLETKVRIDLPAEGCCFNYVQAGVVVYDDDDNFLKLVHASIWETRQVEWAKEMAPVPSGYPRYGNTVASAPGEWTWLRVARWNHGGRQHYQAYVSRDGTNWNRAGVWAHNLDSPQLGLVAMGGSGFNAEFDYVKVNRIRVRNDDPL